jgi:hypothetical protein
MKLGPVAPVGMLSAAALVAKPATLLQMIKMARCRIPTRAARLKPLM